MLKSMTAYAFVERSDGDQVVSIEIRSYNSRHLDVVLRLPMGYVSFEEKLKGLVSSNMERGRVELRVGIQDNAEASRAYQLDLQRAKAYLSAVSQMKASLNLGDGDLSIEHLLNVQGVVTAAENQRDIEVFWPLTETAARQALADLDRMRVKEGDFIGQDLRQRLDLIEKGLGNIEADAMPPPINSM